MNKETEQLLKKAEQAYKQNFSNITKFERAIFLSWYCALGDCTFCYMSTQKNKIKNPKLAKRKLSSILAEVLLTKELGWGIEFLSAGYGACSSEELLKIVESCFKVSGEKLWLNVGHLNEKQLQQFLPFIKGISASIETVNWKIRKKVCPSKPLEPIVETLKLAEKYGLSKSITIIIGLGETKEDCEELFKFVDKYKLSRITFYSLNPHKGTPFASGPKTEDYLWWVAQTRIKFPKLEIIAGSWVNRLDEIHLLLQAGANNFTKFPALKLFGSSYAKKIEYEVAKAGRELSGSLTKLPKPDWKAKIALLPLEEKLREEIHLKLKQYLKRISY